MTSNPKLITWINHFSILEILKSGVALDIFDFVGVDGIFLRFLLKSKQKRTSADLVLPIILKNSRAKYITIGGKEEIQIPLSNQLRQTFPDSTLVLQLNGYTDIQNHFWIDKLLTCKTDLIIIGLGAPLQEQVALRIRQIMQESGQAPLIFTCGGWLDQILIKNYYPKFSYKFRLNWLVRVVREPSRLWRRYTVNAIQAILMKKAIRKKVYTSYGYLEAEDYFENFLFEICQSGFKR